MKMVLGPQAPKPAATTSTWSPSRKTAVGTACNPGRQTWFTVGNGILNETFFPRIDQPCIKDCGFIVVESNASFFEEKSDLRSTLISAGPGIPALDVVNSECTNKFRIHKQIIADPEYEVVLQKVRFEVLQGNPRDYRIFVLLAPHLGDEGVHNTAEMGRFKGRDFLLAQSKEAALAMACSSGWKDRAVGFSGSSDGWQDLFQHRKLTWHYTRAQDGDVALTGEIEIPTDGSFVLAIGFGHNVNAAAQEAHASLGKSFDLTRKRYCEEWAEWQSQLLPLDDGGSPRSCLYRQSAAVLRTHQATGTHGGRVASLSVPWGNIQKKFKAGGYHVVWVRDCAQSAMGLLACGRRAETEQTLRYLANVQEEDGSWPQAMWLDGSPYLTSIQVDSIAAALILYEIGKQEGVFQEANPASRHWPMVRKAATFICRNGPTTLQDRWERNSGFSIYTLSFAVAGLVVAGIAAVENGEVELGEYFLSTADAWNALIESWTYIKNSLLAQKLGISGYYCRIVPADDQGLPLFDGTYPLTNSLTKKEVQTQEVVSPDVWALARYGLRPADDERIRESTVAVDATLKRETPRGPVWLRYNHDGYGETPEGEAFAQQGIGRGWPLLTGERAHYELSLSKIENSLNLFASLEALAGRHGLLPEQVWESEDIPEKGLFSGRATWSARPLAWAHAEHLQLLRSLREKRIFNCPKVVFDRYVIKSTPSRYTVWRVNLQTPKLIPGTILRLELENPAHVEWSTAVGTYRAETIPSPIGLHYVDLPTQELQGGQIEFSFWHPDTVPQENPNYSVQVGPSPE